jgi:hypothetical protein
VAELDYAFLADYARVDPTGTLTAVGASYTHAIVQSIPTNHLVSVAGRVRSTLGTPPVELEVKFSPPDRGYSLAFTAELIPDNSPSPYEGNKVGLLFAITTGLPIISEGLYEVEIFVDGNAARLLKFEASLPTT